MNPKRMQEQSSKKGKVTRRKNISYLEMMAGVVSAQSELSRDILPHPILVTHFFLLHLSFRDDPESQGAETFVVLPRKDEDFSSVLTVLGNAPEKWRGRVIQSRDHFDHSVISLKLNRDRFSGFRDGHQLFIQSHFQRLPRGIDDPVTPPGKAAG